MCPFCFCFPIKTLNNDKDSKQELCWHQEMEGSEKQPPNSIWWADVTTRWVSLRFVGLVTIQLKLILVQNWTFGEKSPDKHLWLLGRLFWNQKSPFKKKNTTKTSPNSFSSKSHKNSYQLRAEILPSPRENKRTADSFVPGPWKWWRSASVATTYLLSRLTYICMHYLFFFPWNQYALSDTFIIFNSLKSVFALEGRIKN